MYFDIDQILEIPENEVEYAIASMAQEILSRNGSVIALSSDILVFSAPFWRVNGLLYLFVRQLPLGVSHGVIQVVKRQDVSEVRTRICLLWLRVCLSLLLVLLMVTALSPGAGNKTILWSAFIASVLAGGVIYAVAIAETRRYFTKMLLGANSARRNGRAIEQQSRQND